MLLGCNSFDLRHFTFSTFSILLQVSVLQFFYVYLQRLTPAALVDAWPALLTLLKDGLSLLDLVPQGKFLLLTILDDFVKRTPQLEERSDIRNLQDITTKIVTDISAVAGKNKAGYTTGYRI